MRFSTSAAHQTTVSHDIAEQYQNESGQVYYDRHFGGVPDSSYPWIARLRAEKFAPYVNEESVVVEFGTGAGWNLAALNCCKRIGVDVNGQFAITAQAQGMDFVESPEKLENESANIVICHHVLEHVTYPPDMLTEARRVLIPGGKLLLFVPFEMQRRFRFYNSKDEDHHLYSWNSQSLGNLVKACGFSLNSPQINSYGYDRFASVLAAKLGIGEAGFRALRRAAVFLRPAHELQIVATKPLANQR